MNHRTYALVALFLFGLSVLPIPALAASKKPSCELTVATNEDTLRVRKDANVLIPKGGTFSISWESDNATKATGPNGSIAREGKEAFTATKASTYKYTFTGSKKVTCEVSVKVAEATLTTTSVAAGKPMLSGTASGTKKVTVELRKDGSSKIVFKKQVSVKKGKWSVKPTKELSSGSYTVTILGDKKYDMNTLASVPLSVGGSDATGSASTNSANLSVSTVPLLFGGAANLGASTPVIYLKVTNTGSTPATFNGVRVKQMGTASTNAIVGLEVRDDKGMTRGIVNRGEGSTPFSSDGTALAPASVTLAAGETRLFTVRALLSSSFAHSGKTIVIDVLGLDGASKGAFPLKGVTWTIR